MRQVGDTIIKNGKRGVILSAKWSFYHGLGVAHYGYMYLVKWQNGSSEWIKE